MNYLRDSEGYVVIGEAKHTRVAIIGSAKTIEGMTGSLFTKSIDAVAKIINEKMPIHQSGVTLVSGGSAWIDHIAVKLFLTGEYAGLHLYTPCEWDCLRIQYSDSGIYDWKENPGGTLNSYHRKFSIRAGIKSLEELDKVNCTPGFSCTVKNGFHARNDLIAQNCDLLIALSWAKDDEPDDGGTLYTWKKATPAYGKVHISLNTL